MTYDSRICEECGERVLPIGRRCPLCGHEHLPDHRLTFTKEDGFSTATTSTEYNLIQNTSLTANTGTGDWTFTVWDV